MWYKFTGVNHRLSNLLPPEVKKSPFNFNIYPCIAKEFIFILITVNNFFNDSNKFRDECFDNLILIFLNYMKATYNGNIEPPKITNEPKLVHDFLSFGFNCIYMGLEPASCSILLEFNIIKLFSYHEVSEEEVMKLLLCKELIPITQKCMVDEFIAIAGNFCSNKINSEVFNLERYQLGQAKEKH